MFLALGLAGCPGKSPPQLVLPKQPDAYDQWAQGLQQEDAFYAELQRLQRLYTAEPDLSLAAPNNYDGQYTLSSRVEEQRAGLVLTERTTKQQWSLWFYDTTGAGAPKPEDTLPPPSAGPAQTSADPGRYAPDADPRALAPQRAAAPRIEILRNEPTAGGYKLELSLNGGEVAVNVTARWLQGRFLQCTRELTLGGLDQAKQADVAQTAWVLDGAWLPYRLAPGLSGPYGIVPDTQADGAWYSKLYPMEAMVPAVAAFDRTHGFMLAVTDDHPRKLDRRYELGYAIPRGHVAGMQIRVAYTMYDGTRDCFDRPWLASGLPIRDSIVLEPFALQCKSADPALVEAEAAEVVQHVADFVHAFHFVPQPPALPEPGPVVRAGQLPELAARLGQNATVADGLTQAVGPCGARLCLLDPWTAQARPAGPAPSAKPEPVSILTGIGIDDTGLSGGKPLAEEQVQRLQQLKQGGLPVLAETSLHNIPYYRHPETPNLPQMQPAWFVDDDDGQVLADRLALLKQGADCGWPETVAPNWRSPQAKAWFTRKLVEDLARYPDVAGYCLTLPGPRSDRATDGAVPSTPLTGSFEAQTALFQLHLGEAIRASRSDALILADTMPNLGQPAWCAALLPAVTMPPVASSGAGTAIQPQPTQRLATFLLNRVFEVQPYLSAASSPEPQDPASSTLAAAVMRAVGAPNGMLFEPGSACAGFPAYALHQAELFNCCGELRVLYSEPAQNAYTGGNERPAQRTKQIAVLPADWAGAHAVWVCFAGIGGTMRIDNYNYLSVSWEGGGWTDKLPTGYWEIEHPSKGAKIEPGDAVLILFKPMAPLPSAGKPIG
jgi:hypothetical protein